MITQLICPTCNKRTELLSEKMIGTGTISQKLKCGHNQFIKKLSKDSEEDTLKKACSEIISLEGDKLFQHQIDCTLFTLLKANGRICIFDEVGVGKTVETIIPIVLRKKEMLPALVICKSIAKMNWLKHWLSWGEVFSQIITSSKDRWFEKFPVHIISYEMLRRITEGKNGNNYKVVLDSKKTIIADESHLIKNDTSGRTKCIKKVCEGKKFVFMLSGTQVENVSSELFPVFNIVRPDRFHNRDRFLRDYWDVYRDGWSWKVGKLLYPENFKQDTEDFVIRRKMDDVLPNLPPVRRNNLFVELGDKVKGLYDAEVAKFSQFYNQNKGTMNSFEFMSNILARLNILRQITGMAKVESGVDFTEEFLDGSDRKLVIFVHHHRVAELYTQHLNKLLSSRKLDELAFLRAKDIQDAENILDEFKSNTNRRVLLASTQASGQSINMQFVSDCLLSERQWTPSKEEQAGVGRFRRPGQKNTINFNYLIAVGTVDEHLTQIIERKIRHIAQIDGAYKGESVPWEESSILKELAEMLANSGNSKWVLK